VGVKSLRAVNRKENDDCSGLIRLAYAPQQVALEPERPVKGEGGVQGMYRRAKALGALRETAAPGHLVFFKETLDRNKDGKRNDGLTHIGIVESVEPDGTVVFIHRSRGGVKRGRMNLAQPGVRKDASGKVLNDYLRFADRITQQRLAGQLFAGYAQVDARWSEEAEAVAGGSSTGSSSGHRDMRLAAGRARSLRPVR
jgi:hypothetical protein